MNHNPNEETEPKQVENIQTTNRLVRTFNVS